MQISDPQTNLYIVAFLGGFIGNLLQTVLTWWNTEGKYKSEGIVVKFDNRAVLTAIATLIPVAITTGALFSSILNAVNASNPVSYLGAFGVALGFAFAINYGVNKTVPFNTTEKNELKLREIETHAKLHAFNQQIKEEASNQQKQA